MDIINTCCVDQPFPSFFPMPQLLPIDFNIRCTFQGKPQILLIKAKSFKFYSSFKSSNIVVELALCTPWLHDSECIKNYECYVDTRWYAQ